MAESIIHRFESIQIQVADRQQLAIALGLCGSDLQAVAQQHTIGQMGERIVVGQVLELILRLLALGDIAADHDQALACAVRVKGGYLDDIENHLRAMRTGNDFIRPAGAPHRPGLLIARLATQEGIPVEAAVICQLRVFLAHIVHAFELKKLQIEFIRQQPAALAILETDDIRHGIDQGAQHLLAAFQGGFHGLLFRDVPADAKQANDIAKAVFDWPLVGANPPI